MLYFVLLFLNTINKQLRKDLFQFWFKVGWFYIKVEYYGRESFFNLW